MKTSIRLFHWLPRILCIIAILLLGGSNLFARDSSSNGKALNFPAKKYGISIGNSHEFTGIRINFADENVKRINGLNVTFWLRLFKNKNAIVNGISVGIIPTGGTLRPVNLGVLGTGTSQNLSGLSLGGVVIGATGNIKGLSVSGLVLMADGHKSVISGIAMSGIGLGCGNTINGLAIAGLALGADVDINGVTSSLAYIGCKNRYQGLAVTGGYLDSKMFKGVAIAGFSKTNQLHGLSIGLYNRTKELHGIQLGFVNYAGNNPKGLRMLPFINLHL
jgi:hypothetical protein